MSLERHHIQLLLALRDAGTLSQAAELLVISPSAASHRLREAERRLGIELVEPDGRTIRLTPSGRHLADAAAVAESALEAAERTARWLHSGRGAVVRLALDFYDTTPWYFAVAGRPGARRVDAVRIGFRRLDEALARRQVDLGIEVRAHGQQGERDHLLTDDELIGLVPVEHPAARRGRLRPDDVIDAAYLTAGDAPTQGFEHSEFMIPAGVEPREIIRIESVALLRQLVARGRGITILPRLAAEPGQPTGVVPIPLDGAPIRIHWVARTRIDPIPATVEVLDELRSVARAPTGEA